jgi:hypothetical protein
MGCNLNQTMSDVQSLVSSVELDLQMLVRKLRKDGNDQVADILDHIHAAAAEASVLIDLEIRNQIDGREEVKALNRLLNRPEAVR